MTSGKFPPILFLEINVISVLDGLGTAPSLSSFDITFSRPQQILHQAGESAKAFLGFCGNLFLVKGFGKNSLGGL